MALGGVKGYLYLTIVLVALAVAGGLYAKGRLDATHTAERERLERQVEDLEQAAKVERAARALDASQAKEDAEAMDAMEAKVKELDDQLKDRDAVCFDGDDADRLRDTLWGKDPAPRRLPGTGG